MSLGSCVLIKGYFGVEGEEGEEEGLGRYCACCWEVWEEGGILGGYCTKGYWIFGLILFRESGDLRDWDEWWF